MRICKDERLRFGSNARRRDYVSASDSPLRYPFYESFSGSFAASVIAVGSLHL